MLRWIRTRGGRLACRAAMVAALAASTGCAHDPTETRSMATRPLDRALRPVLSYRWRFVLADRAGEHKPQEFASPAISETGARLFIGSHEGDFYALERVSGRVLWRVDLGAASSKAAVDAGRVYVGTDDGALVCLSALDGEIKWRYETKGAVLETPVVSGDLVLFANEADQVYALDRRTGEFRWQYKSETPEEYTLRGHGGVALAGELVVAGFSNGNLVALRQSSGSVAWIASLAAGNDRFVDVDSTPIVLGDTVYASSSAGGVFGLDATTGRIEWRLPITGAGPLASDGKTLYLGAATQGMYATDLAGHVLWRQGAYGGGEAAEPILAGDYVFFSLSEVGMYIVDRRTGQLREYFDPGFGVSAPATVEGDDLYVLSNGDVLYAMNLAFF